jgi:hypothetical protein
MTSSSGQSYIGVFCVGGIALIFLVIGIALILKSRRDKQKASASRSWPSTTGRITNSGVSSHTSRDSDGDMEVSYSISVEYEYAVKGQNFNSRNISFGARNSHRHRSQAEAELANYQVGKTVAVFYNPANPEEAVLERNASGSNALAIIGIIFTVMGALTGCGMIAAILFKVISG